MIQRRALLIPVIRIIRADIIARRARLTVARPVSHDARCLFEKSALFHISFETFMYTSEVFKVEVGKICLHDSCS